MSFTLKQIDGEVVEKKAVILSIEDRRSCIGYAIDLREIRNCEIQDEGRKWLITKISNFLYEIANKFTAIDAQSSVKLRINRGKLIDLIHNFSGNPYTGYSSRLAYSESLADTIIAADKDIVEVCNDLA